MAKTGRILSIIMAVGAGVITAVTEISNNRREAQNEEMLVQMGDIIERVDKYLPKIEKEGE